MPRHKKTEAAAEAPAEQTKEAAAETATATAESEAKPEAPRKRKRKERPEGEAATPKKTIITLDNVPKSIKVESNKNYKLFSKGEQTAWLRGKTLGLSDYKKGLPTACKEVSEGEAKKRHLGSTRALAKVKSEAELIDILKGFFD